MPRNGSGTFTLAQPPFVPQTPISSAAVNSDLSDIASALTGSLARDGQGGMTDELPLANAGFSYSSDPNTGMHRTGADAQAIECGGVDIVTLTSTTMNVTGALMVGGAALLPIGLGPLPWSGLTAPPKWVLAGGQELLRASYPALWAFAQAEISGGNTLYTNGNGTTTFTVADMRGRVPAGNDSMVLGSANRLNSVTMTPAGNILGAVNTVAGGQVVTLNAAQIPSITSSGNNNISVSPQGTFAYLIANSQDIFNINVTIGGSTVRAPGNTASMTLTQPMTGSNSISVTSNNTGSGAHSNVQPTIITNYIIYAGA